MEGRRRPAVTNPKVSLRQKPEHAGLAECEVEVDAELHLRGGMDLIGYAMRQIERDLRGIGAGGRVEWTIVVRGRAARQ